MSVAPTAALLSPTAERLEEQLHGGHPPTRHRQSLLDDFTIRSQTFAWWWFALLTMHVLNGLATYTIARLYLYLADPAMAYTVDALDVSTLSLRRSGYSFAVVAAAHGVTIAQVLFYSIRHRQLMFSAPIASKTSTRQARGGVCSQTRIGHVLGAVWTQVRRPWAVLFSRNGYFGINGALFDLGFEVREAVEIVLQTYQAYYLSKSVPKRWINSLAVVTIVLNCCATPLAHLCFRGHARTLERRIFCRLADMVLDMCCSLVIPLSIILPYVNAFDMTILDFRIELFYDDVWYVNAIAEGQYVLITSATDYISTMLPHVSVFACLVSIESLLAHAPSHSRCSRSRAQDDLAKVVPDGSASSPTSSQSALSSFADRIKPHRKTRLVVHTAFMLWGAGVAFLHLYAQYNTWTERPGCKLHVSSWFTQSYPCSFMEVNCYRQEIVGHADEVATVLHGLDRLALRTLLLTHCPTLHMPSEVQAFPLLGGIEVFNCSLVHWGPEAAVTQAFHSKMLYAIIMYSNLTQLPDGLYHTDLPTRFTRLGLTETNFHTIPDDIDVRWGSRDGIFLDFGQCELTSVPASLGRLSVFTLSLQANAIASVPASLFDNAGKIGLIDLSFNPIVSLPATITTMHAMEIQAIYTNLTDIPAWLRDWAKAGVLATSTVFGTPFCNDAGGTATTTVSSSASARAVASQLCVEKPTQQFPVDIVLPQRLP